MAVVVCSLGAVRDFTVAAVLPDVIWIGPAPASIFADMAAWAVVVADVALGVTRLVAGPADADELR